MKFSEIIQSADWKNEKHSPAIDVAKEGDAYKVTASIGKEIGHPNTTAHHIAWMELYFKPEGGKFPYLLGRYDFSAHGAGTDGADTSGVYAEPYVSVLFKTEKKGTLLAKSYCNIHGLWESSAEL